MSDDDEDFEEFYEEVASQDSPHDRALASHMGPLLEDKHVNIACETSYRRGFDQGVAAAIEAVEKGYELGRLIAWKYRLHSWRCKRHKGKIEYPEWLGRTERKPK